MSSPIVVIRNALLGSLVSDKATRTTAEAELEAIFKHPESVLGLLETISLSFDNSIPENHSVRLSGCVYFKNYVKNSWSIDSDRTIPEPTKDIIRSNLVDLMCRAPPDAQKLLSEAMSLIAEYDFPQNWPKLLPDLISKLGPTDVITNRGVLNSLNSILKRFRYTSYTEKLVEDLKYCLTLHDHLVTLVEANGALIEKSVNDKEALIVLLEVQRLIYRVFYSLNWLELSDEFEASIEFWMTNFLKYLNYSNPLLVDTNEREQPGPVEKLHGAIIDNLNLYASKYDEEFARFLPPFSQMVWQLLMKIGTEPKFDILATRSIRFLTSISSKQMNINLFQGEVLQTIIEQIVVKNLTASESDEELFEDNPTEYIRKDMEGSDHDTRRRCATELVRGLLKFFGAQVSDICNKLIVSLLQNYTANRDWRLKDTALHLVIAVSVMSTSSASGNINLNPQINILDIFQTQVFTELNNSNNNSNHAIIKADALKMLCVYRSQFTVDMLVNLISNVTRFLESDNEVLQTYAALCLERFMSIKDTDPTTGQSTLTRLRKEHVQSLSNNMLSGLFHVLDRGSEYENEYVLKTVMKIMLILENDVASLTPLILNKLSVILERICRNSANPHFNHYLFECIALLIRGSCNIPNDSTATIAACNQFESMLFPSIQIVLNQNISEFMPYSLQLLAQLLGHRPQSSGLSDTYKALLPFLLMPAQYSTNNRGNVPALVSLLRAYLKVGSGEIVNNQQLVPILGVFQNLLAFKTTELNSFELLNSIIEFVDFTSFSSYSSTVFSLILTRLRESMTQSTTPKFAKYVVHFLGHYGGRYGGATLFEALESQTSGLTANLLARVLEPNADFVTAFFNNRQCKEALVGYTKLMVESPLSKDNASLKSIVNVCANLIVGASASKKVKGDLVAAATDNDLSDDIFNRDEQSMEYENAFSKLIFATVSLGTSNTSEIDQSVGLFCQGLKGVVASNPAARAVLGAVAKPDVLNDAFAKNNMSL